MTFTNAKKLFSKVKWKRYTAYIVVAALFAVVLLLDAVNVLNATNSRYMMLVAVYLFCRSADQTFLMLCVAIGGGASVYFGTLLLMRDAFLMENIKMVYARLRNKRNRQAPDGKG